MRGVSRILWRLLAISALILGLIGIPLPGLPTVPFMIVAAWAGSKGWPALEIWLLNHADFGEPIRQWRAYRAIPTKAKILSSVMMFFSGIIFWLMDHHLYLKCTISIVFVLVAVWIWRRPTPHSRNSYE